MSSGGWSGPSQERCGDTQKRKIRRGSRATRIHCQTSNGTFTIWSKSSARPIRRLVPPRSSNARAPIVRITSPANIVRSAQRAAAPYFDTPTPSRTPSHLHYPKHPKHDCSAGVVGDIGLTNMLWVAPEKTKAAVIGVIATGILAALIVIGSRNLDHFDAALVGYTFATLFATFGITYRYAMWLQRPPTRMYWRRGWQVFLRPRFLLTNLYELGRRFMVEFVANRFIFRRGRSRWAAHWLIMWGCLLAAAITFPLVWGWIHFESVPGRLDLYRTYVFGFPVHDFPIESAFGFLVFHGLVWASFFVIVGV